MKDQKLRQEIENAITSSVIIMKGHPIDRAVDKIVKIIKDERNIQEKE